MTKRIPFEITTKTTYLLKESDPLNLRFVWSYEISIHNQGNEIVQLLNRLWRITDLTGRIEEVKGLGVVGEQPLIKPNKVYTYTSLCQLMTPQGTMEGEYGMQNLEEMKFIVGIPKFVLCAPHGVMQPFKSRLH